MQNREQKLSANILRRHRRQVQKGRERKSSIPGPKEAKECMQAIEKQHLTAKKIRLLVCYTNLYESRLCRSLSVLSFSLFNGL